MPPTLLVVGGQDFPMLEDARAFARKSEGFGDRVGVIVVPGEDHNGSGVHSRGDDRKAAVNASTALTLLTVINDILDLSKSRLAGSIGPFKRNHIFLSNTADMPVCGVATWEVSFAPGELCFRFRRSG
jgi:acetyl esterase/lipase